MSKIISMIEQRKAEGKKGFSYEFFPPRTEAGAPNLLNRIEYMAHSQPMFVDITWGAGGTGQQDPTDPRSSMFIAEMSQNMCHMETMLHLTCTNNTQEEILAVLEMAKEKGIRNILALRGDPVEGTDEFVAVKGGFRYGVDLVKFIREKFGDYFGICVAGYPLMHPEADSEEQDIQYLKEKVDAGADFIITQLFFKPEQFLDWRSKCVAAGITCPIIPGILPIQSYASLRHLCKLSGYDVPIDIVEAVEPFKHDDAAISAWGVDFAVDMCEALLKNDVSFFHVYTLNREASSLQIVKSLGLDTSHIAACRELPWRGREGEACRPIHWQHRPLSYASRTAAAEFPNGRFGPPELPSYGSLNAYHIFHKSKAKPESLRKQWGHSPTSYQDVSKVFVAFLTGEAVPDPAGLPTIPVKKLPWCNRAEVSFETEDILSTLVCLNKAGFLTVNSQPKVNGVPSTDPKYGWGAEGGYVYQKAYVEFWTSPSRMTKLVKAAKKYPNISFIGVNHDKSEVHQNYTGDSALTWGVFPGSLLVQPTVSSPKTFKNVWAEEAFALWKEWARIYPEDSAARRLLDHVHSTHFLVSVIDNDFINGDISKLFMEVIAEELLAQDVHLGPFGPGGSLAASRAPTPPTVD